MTTNTNWRKNFDKKIGEVHWDDADATIYVKDFIDQCLKDQKAELLEAVGKAMNLDELQQTELDMMLEDGVGLEEALLKVK